MTAQPAPDEAVDAWRQVEEVFHEALEQPARKRQAWLRARCGGDGKLLAEVALLLAADEGSETVVEDAVADAVRSAAEGIRSTPEPGAGPEIPPERVGAYRILEEIGRGGLATVYLAERDDEQFRKQVAVKVLRRGLDTDDVLQRFRHERQILARFEHPHIARILDGGSTEDGRPFFVMEHVDGVPIDEFCADRRLGLRERIELFRAVCDAVGYAHQSLVVHRDLKPGNVLVTGEGQPKLLDFGIAKLLDPEELAVTELRTRTGLLLLTPAYASPEQLAGESLTTQTDVYSLGVVLYQLLTGRPPFVQRRRRLEAVAADLPKGEPLRPSAAVTEDSRQAAGLPLPLSRLRRRLQGDLDTIVLQALRRDPQRRYASVAFLSEDLRRYLAGERVLARPESFAYRLSKLLRRNRAAATILAAAAGVLLAVVAFYTLELRRERDAARWQAERAERVSSLLVGLLEVSDPSRARGETITVRELLEPAAERLATELAGQPAMRASLEELIGSIYGNLGLYREAEPLLTSALATRRSLYEEPHPKVADSLDHLGELSYQKGDYEQAEAFVRQALEQRLATLGAGHPAVSKSLNDLAALMQARGRPEEAETFYRQALAGPNPDASETVRRRQALITRANLASLLYSQSRLEESEQLLRSTLQDQRSLLGDDHPDVAVTENTLAAVLVSSERPEEAEALLRRGLERQRHLFGDEHPNVAVSLTNLGAFLYHRQRYDEAEALYREALALQERTLEGETSEVLTTVVNLANLEYYGRMDMAAASPWLHRAESLQKKLLGADHPQRAGTLLQWAIAEGRLGNRAAAERLLAEALALEGPAGAEARSEQQEKRILYLQRLLAEGGAEATGSPR